MDRPSAHRLTPFAAIAGAVAVLPWSAARTEPIDFERDIRPILAEKCTLCHGPDEAKGGLRLNGIDAASSVLKSGRRGIVPGEPEASEVLARVLSPESEERMPPPGKGEALGPEEVAKLEQWIAEGAVWPRHWAYAPLRRPEPPALPQATEAETGQAPPSPIDAFVRARLRAANIAPSPPADASTLIRRLYCDLIGLPPTPEQTEAHLAALGADPEAGLRALVDELLDSPAFGERWGRHWLDRARYADSDGYEKDNHRPDAWRYRDWVLSAIQADMPLDRFTIEQFAGDLLENPTPEQRLATAFNRQTLTNTEGGVDKEQWRVAAVMDRVETLGTVWLGLTLGCARCHTHKYDEITQREYYALFAYFNNADEDVTRIPQSPEAWAKYQQALKAHEAETRSKEQALEAARTELREQREAWEEKLASELRTARAVATAEQRLLDITQFAAPKGVQFAKEPDGSLVVGGENPATAVYTVTATLPPGPITGLRLEVLPDRSLGSEGPGRAGHGNFVLNRVEVSVEGHGTVKLADAAADYAQSQWPVREALSENVSPGRQGSGWAVGGATGKAHQADFGFAEALSLPQGGTLTLTLTQNFGGQHTIGRFRLQALTSPTELALPESVRAYLDSPPDRRSEAHGQAFWRHVEWLDPRTRPLLADLEAHQAKRPQAPEMEVRILTERSTERRRTHRLRRGEFTEPLEEVQPGTLSVLPPVRHRGPGGDRLDLAHWLVSGENPLPPRVLANDIWTQLFGEGLVRTPEDFGVRGDRPTHPELLDWLAVELIESGWSRKSLIRTIVLSQTYRQRSDHRPDLLDRDPKNELLARQNRFRVEAEIVRDLSLAAAGLLSRKVGGPSVFPPIPEGVADVNYNSAFVWKPSTGEDRYRRGLYTYFKRTAPHPSLITFDCPDSNGTAVRRARSNTPLAALVTLNSEAFVEAAQGLARRVLSDASLANDAARVDQAFRLCLTRSPRDFERARLLSLLGEARHWYRSREEAAVALLGSEAIDGVSPSEAAAWLATLRVLLNLDEFLTRA